MKVLIMLKIIALGNFNSKFSAQKNLKWKALGISNYFKTNYVTKAYYFAIFNLEQYYLRTEVKKQRICNKENPKNLFS